MKQHKWHKEIKAWADGAEIEYGFAINKTPEWFDDDDNPCWKDDTLVFRIKPQPKEPQYLYAYMTENGGIFVSQQKPFEYLQKEYLGKIKLEDDDVGAT
jgi:hypothetical protein